MLLERNQVLVGAVFVVLLAAGTFFGIVFDRSWITGGEVVTAVFADAAGLKAGDSVMIAGIRSGEVERVWVGEDGQARAALRVTAPMPADTHAGIILQNFLGKRAVALAAGIAWDDPLESGDIIPRARTSTPTDFAELNEESAALLRNTDVEALGQLISSLADVTDGQRDEVGRLVDGLRRLTEVIARREQQLRAAIDTSEDVVSVLADKDREIVRIVDRFGTTLDTLARRRQEITRLLRETAGATNRVTDLVATDRAQLDRTLAELHRDLKIVDAHQVDLAHTFAYAGAAFEGYASIFRSGGRDNPYWGYVFTQSLGTAGVDALLGCDGVVEGLLDEVFGPDPRGCTVDLGDDPEDNVPPGGERAGHPPGLRSLFSGGLTTGDRP